MPNPLPALIKRYVSAMSALLRKARSSLVGLAQDFWKDGDWSKTGTHNDLHDSEANQFSKDLARARAAELAAQNIKAGDLWHALPGEIAEKMWGEGYLLPGDAKLSEQMISPLGLTKDMSVLDLSAGFGTRVRKTIEEFGVFMTGLESDAEIVARAKELSASSGKRVDITCYATTTLTSERKYDCVLVRETLYRAADKPAFIKALVGCCKPTAQISFTDYVVNPEDRTNPVIAAWCAFETGANPAGLVEMAEIWAKEGVNIRVHDDLTDFYKTEVKAGLVRFAKFMGSGIKPDTETAKAINQQITLWAHRMAAMEQGLKFYRFYGQR